MIMKVILYMAITANGMIARKDDSVSWSDLEWKSFSSTVNKIGNLIIGRRTYDLMKSGNEFSKFKKVKIVVVTNSKISGKKISVAKSPKEALKVLEKLKFNEILVAGGGRLNSSFMKQSLIDEIYLDVEPLILGKGIKLFADEDFEAKLELIETKMLSKNEIQLYYKVKK